MCFRAPGTANQNTAYIGADCSQRVCPFGRSHDIVRWHRPCVHWRVALLIQRPHPLAPRSQITDDTVSFLPQSVSADHRDVGFVSADGASEPKLQVFLNGGFLLSKDLGIDLRVVSVVTDSLSPYIKFQWKTNTQKVRETI